MVVYPGLKKNPLTRPYVSGKNVGIGGGGLKIPQQVIIYYV